VQRRDNIIYDRGLYCRDSLSLGVALPRPKQNRVVRIRQKLNRAKDFTSRGRLSQPLFPSFPFVEMDRPALRSLRSLAVGHPPKNF
jgi:hypothetical protein